MNEERKEGRKDGRTDGRTDGGRERQTDESRMCQLKTLNDFLIGVLEANEKKEEKTTTKKAKTSYCKVGPSLTGIAKFSGNSVGFTGKTGIPRFIHNSRSSKLF